MASKKMIATTLILGLMVVATGCSDSNNPVTAAPDTAPPAPPSGLAVMAEGGTAVLNWAPNTVDSDLAGYVVIRDYQGVVETLVASPTMNLSFRDESELVGERTYAVHAVDTSGNESAAATAYLVLRGPLSPSVWVD